MVLPSIAAHARHLRLEAGDPRRKGSLKRLRIERPQNPAQGLSRRDALTKGEKPAKPVKLLLAEHRDPVEILHPAQKPVRTVSSTSSKG
jgi:hypothetical protein